jgi:hypothetical protein
MTVTPDLVGPQDLAAFQAGSPTRALLAAQALVRSYCGWHIAPTITETITVDGWANNVLMLPTLWLLEVSSIVVGDVEVDLSTVQLYQAGYLARQFTFPTLDTESIPWTTAPGPRAVVTMTHCYADPPEDLANVALAIAARSLSTPLGVEQVQRGPFVYRYSPNLLDLDRQVLDTYKLPAAQ